MAHSSTIEWTQTTWNPVIGCQKVSEGCKHCYAERMSRRLAAMARGEVLAGRNPGKKALYEQVIDSHGRWNGNVYLDYKSVDVPKSWTSPRMIFVNSMSDLFHEDVSPHFVERVFETMNECSRHTFQILTKRPWRAAKLASSLRWGNNIWIGTSIENLSVSSRVTEIRKIPAAVRFLSIEPLLGPIRKLSLKGIHWVIVGGESGPSAREMKPEWVRQLRDLCLSQGVAFFFKQWGGPNKKKTGRLLDGRVWNQMPTVPQTVPEILSGRRTADRLAC